LGGKRAVEIEKKNTKIQRTQPEAPEDIPGWKCSKILQ